MRLSKSSPAASILGILTGRGRDCVIRIGWPSGSCQPVLTDALRISQVRRSYTSHGHPDGQRTEGERAIWNALPLRQARNNSSCDAARREDACRQPIKPLVNAIFALELGANNFRDILRQILDGLDTAQHSHHADTCNDCIFLAGKGPELPANTQAEFTCRFFRAAITKGEIDLLCFNFERREGRKRSPRFWLKAASSCGASRGCPRSSRAC